MTEQEIIKMMQMAATGEKLLGGELNPELKKAIEAVYLKGYNDGCEKSRNRIKTLETKQDMMIKHAKAEQRHDDERAYYEVLEDKDWQIEQNQRELKQLKEDRDKAAELLQEAISLLSKLA